jgi:hypothetical protein
MNLEIFRNLVRREFRIFFEVGDSIQLSADDRRRALALSERQWADWTGLLTDGPLPDEPVLPEMLQRLGNVTWSLAVAAEERGVFALA